MNFKRRQRQYVKFLVYLAAVILANVAGITLFFRADLTANDIYSISESSKKVVSTLSEPLTIDVFFTKDLPAPHNNTERYLKDLFAEYAAHASQNFSYRFYDVSPDEGNVSEEATKNRELAKSYGINPVQVQVIEHDEVKFQKAYMGLVMIHGDLIENIPMITTTDGLEYRLTTAMQRMNNKISALLRLKDKVQVKLYLSSTLKEVAPYMGIKDLDGLPNRVRAIVEKLNRTSYGKLEFKQLDPTNDQSLIAEMKTYNVFQVKWPSLDGGRVAPGEGVIGLGVTHGAKKESLHIVKVFRIPFIGTRYELPNPNELEEMISTSVESLIDINEDLGYLADYGTMKLSGADPVGDRAHGADAPITTFQSLVSKSYTLKEINLKDNPIPGGLKSLVIARPVEKFSDYALFQIDQFLLKGKNLILFLDAFQETAMPQQYMGFQPPAYSPISTGLEALLDHYGVRIKKSYVLDENCFKQQRAPQMGGGEVPIYFAPLIKNELISKSEPFLRDIKGLVTMKASPLELDAARLKQDQIDARKLFSSSEKSWEMRDQIDLNPMFLRPPSSSQEQKNMPLAYILEGEFSSFFVGKPIPERSFTQGDGATADASQSSGQNNQSTAAPKFETSGQFIAKGKRGRIFIMGSSQMLSDAVLDPEGRSPNALFVLNVIDAMNNHEDTALMRGKQQIFNPLKEAGGGSKTLVKSLNVGGLPLLVSAFGIGVWFYRRARMRRIQAMFQS